LATHLADSPLFLIAETKAAATTHSNSFAFFLCHIAFSTIIHFWWCVGGVLKKKRKRKNKEGDDVQSAGTMS
jgi:hypothetical protein